MSSSRFVSKAVIGFALLLIAVVLAIEVFKVGSVKVPSLEVAPEIVYLDQGWRDGWAIGETQWFHHADQGAKLLEYEWFMALEQPELSIFGAPDLLASSDYLQRFGFVPSQPHKKYNPDNLPIGFAVNNQFQEPYGKKPKGGGWEYDKPPYKVVGLTCAACHTGRLHYQGKAIHIEGGSASIDLGLFRKALGRSIYYTELFPWRFKRFARRVLGDDYSAEQGDELRGRLRAFVAKVTEERDYARQKQLNELESGFGRTDALARIVNRIFKDLNRENLGVTDAPVNFPPIWDATWFNWVQYNASIRPPMVRNIGEVLGVGGMVNLDRKRGRMWDSTVNVTNLHWMERQISGGRPFSGLRSPKWPEQVLGKIDPELKEEGRVLFESLCLHCHGRIDDIRQDLEVNGERAIYWTKPNIFGRQFIRSNYQLAGNIERIGTDPAQALNFARRVVVIPGQRMLVAGAALEYTTSRVREEKYEKLELSDEQVTQYDGYRLPWEEFTRELLAKRAVVDEDTGNDVRSVASLLSDVDEMRDSKIRLAYKARPLNGAWATAPYLHNGSVPNLYQLLSTVKRRDKQFFVGSREYDPRKMGFVSKPIRGAFEFDTTLPGNLNIGHEFRGKPGEPRRKGVIGRRLSHEEKLAIIEYLKSL